ncbi:hypothetical protein C1893_11230 [Pseudomonas sp. MPR-ANC1]|nr:hypothetical protein C1893_11230 [Pseudomonas sp. MPR-ANC1]
MWERTCSRKRCAIQHPRCLTRPHREQARSHIGIACRFRIEVRSCLWRAPPTALAPRATPDH